MVHIKSPMSSWIQHHFLPLLAQNRKSILVIRHGHREEAKQGNFGNDLALTSEGRQASLSLGQSMASLLFGEIHTSPLLRCIQTTEEFLKGANQKVPIVRSKMLGDPGPFTIDPIRAGPLFLQQPLEEIAQQIADHEKLPGMRTLDEGGHTFLKHLAQIKRFPCLMVTHDIIICLLCCFLFKSKDVKKYFPNFLEGFGMIIHDSHLSIHHLQQKNNLSLANLGLKI